ncbi:MAG: TetR/AcrR family transcriptional regulator [Pseudomonadota bacterium]
MSPRTSLATPAAGEPAPSPDVRQRILDTASDLFYREGVRAIGIDLVIERAQVAKTSLYRHFRTKDDLVAAFLTREDEEFWGQWDEVVKRHAPEAGAELDALLQWVGQRVARPGYRGCPQLNVAAEFADPEHPARRIAAAHKLEQQRRLAGICKRLGAKKPDLLAAQLSMLIDGAFTSGSLLLGDAAGKALRAAGAALAAASLK